MDCRQAERVAKIREAKAALEAEAKAAAEEYAAPAEAEEKRKAEGKKRNGRRRHRRASSPTAELSATSPIRNRILKSKDGFIQSYNAQAAVDG